MKLVNKLRLNCAYIDEEKNNKNNVCSDDQENEPPFFTKRGLFFFDRHEIFPFLLSQHWFYRQKGKYRKQKTIVYNNKF